MEARTSSPEQLITDSRSPSVTDTSSEQEAIASKEKTLDSPASKERALDSPLSQSPAHTTRGGRIKPITLCVYTLKEGTKCTMTFPTGRNTTAEQITEDMMKELGMPVQLQNVFGIWLTSKFLQLQLKPYHLPCKLFKRWRDLLSQYTNATYEEVTKDEPILSFQRNAFFGLKDERKLLDPKLNAAKAIDLLYHEAVFNVTKSRYPMTRDEYHDLAGLQATLVASESFDQNPNPSHYQGSLSKYYPSHMVPVETRKLGKLFKQKSVEGKDTPQLFVKSMKEVCTKKLEAYQLKVLYLQRCWQKPFYGSVFFKGQIKKPFKPVHLLVYTDKLVTVAINADCLHLFSVSAQPETLLYLPYDLLSWELAMASEEGEDLYSSLWLEFDSVLNNEGGEAVKVAKRIQVFSRQAPMMDAMIGRCVAEINKKEEELRQLRLQQGNQEFLPEVSIKTPCAQGESPRVQRQERNFKEDKLGCEVYSEDGSQTSNFTISRVLKRKKSKPTLLDATTVSNPAYESANTEVTTVPNPYETAMEATTVPNPAYESAMEATTVPNPAYESANMEVTTVPNPTYESAMEATTVPNPANESAMEATTVSNPANESANTEVTTVPNPTYETAMEAIPAYESANMEQLEQRPRSHSQSSQGSTHSLTTRL